MMKYLPASFIASIVPLAAVLFVSVAAVDVEFEEGSRNEPASFETAERQLRLAREISDVQQQGFQVNSLQTGGSQLSRFGQVTTDRVALQEYTEGRFQSLQAIDEVSSGWMSVSLAAPSRINASFLSADMRMVGVADVMEISADKQYDVKENMLPAVFVFGDESELNSSQQHQSSNTTSRRYRF